MATYLYILGTKHLQFTRVTSTIEKQYRGYFSSQYELPGAFCVPHFSLLLFSAP